MPVTLTIIITLTSLGLFKSVTCPSRLVILQSRSLPTVNHTYIKRNNSGLSLRHIWCQSSHGYLEVHWLLHVQVLTLSEGPASLPLFALSSAADSSRAAQCRPCRRSTLISAIVGLTLSGLWASMSSFERVVVTPTTRMPAKTKQWISQHAAEKLNRS